MAENIQEAQAEVYDVRRFHFHDSGLMQLPVAGHLVNSATVRLHAAREWLAITFYCQNWGSPPTLPDPYSLESNAVFLGGWRGGATPIHDHTMKGRTWTVQGLYLYSLIQPKGLTSPLPTGKAPWDSVDKNENTIESKYFDSTLLGTDQTPTTLYF